MISAENDQRTGSEKGWKFVNHQKEDSKWVEWRGIWAKQSNNGCT